MKVAAIILAAITVLSCTQRATEKMSRGDENTESARNPDTWERSKECAAQAEKVMKEFNRESALGTWGEAWHNHYSPKFNRCFVRAIFTLRPIANFLPVPRVCLFDAFERKELASVPAVDRSPEKPEDDCLIGEQRADCEKAAVFISERMNN